MALLLSKLLVEFLSSNGFSAGKFGGDVLSFKGLENLSHVGVLHGVDIFEEGNQSYELLVAGLTLPGVQNNGVLRLFADVGGVGVEDNDLGQITVEV